MGFQENAIVSCPGGEYPIYIGQAVLSEAALFAPFVANRQVLIITHREIAHHYLSQLKATCLQAKAITCDELLIESGDEHKTLESASNIWSFMLSKHYHKEVVIIALGGGMIGDLAGFSAACYMRGVDYLQCPTTLLAQIDAAIGGKTAINLEQGKNLIGAFYQPKAVLCDLNSLKTLDQREYIAGCAELIKYGLVFDATFFEWFEKNAQLLLSRQSVALEYAVSRACDLKAKVVSLDEKDKGLRLILNFGHTLGHALESLLNYQHLLHGEAVAIGMVAALRLSVQNNKLNTSLLERLISLLAQFGLPTTIPKGIRTVEILSKMKHDKKHINKGLQWVLLSALGEADICETLTSSQIEQALVLCGALP